MVKEIHREGRTSQGALREEEENAQGEVRAEHSKQRVHAGTPMGPCSPLCRTIQLVKGDARRRALVFCPTVGPRLFPLPLIHFASGYGLVRNALASKK